MTFTAIPVGQTRKQTFVLETLGDFVSVGLLVSKKYPGDYRGRCVVYTADLGGVVDCHSCEAEHVAEFSHEGRFGEGPIFAVVCTVDGLTDYYTTEALKP